jgi:hypothetical protein
MANITAHLNVTQSWVSAGASDTCTISDIDQSLRGGVQVELDGLALDGLTAVVTTSSGAEKTVTFAASTGEYALVGEGFSIASIVLSGASAGTRNVRFSQ